jgi:hypothetical protein
MPVTFTCVTLNDVIASARRQADSEGYIDLDALIASVKRLPFTERQYKTPLEYVDDEHQSGAWPPTGRWPVSETQGSESET